MNETDPNMTQENPQAENWDMTPPETEQPLEQTNDDDAPEGAVNENGWVKTKMHDGSLDWVPPVPEGMDPVDFYASEGYPVDGMPGLPDSDGNY